MIAESYTPNPLYIERENCHGEVVRGQKAIHKDNIETSPFTFLIREILAMMPGLTSMEIAERLRIITPQDERPRLNPRHACEHLARMAKAKIARPLPGLAPRRWVLSCHPLTMVERIEKALAGNTRELRNEMELQREIAAAFDRAGIDYEREVPVRGSRKRIDFVVAGSIAVEVKASGGSGMGPWRQLFVYLEDPRFVAGVIVSVKASSQPARHFERADGTLIPLHKIELWKYSL